jgi:hypothetical protein
MVNYEWDNRTNCENFGELRQGEALRMYQPVEIVDVGPVGGAKEPRNKAKTLRIHRFQTSNQGLK